MGVILHAVLFLSELFYTVEQTWQKELVVLYMNGTVPVGTKNSLLSLLLSSLRRDGAVDKMDLLCYKLESKKIEK